MTRLAQPRRSRKPCQTPHTHAASPRLTLANIPFPFSEAELSQIREQLDGLAVSELRDGFAPSGKLHAIFEREPWEKHVAYRDAVACVLIERGSFPSMGDISDQIQVAP